MATELVAYKPDILYVEEKENHLKSMFKNTSFLGGGGQNRIFYKTGFYVGKEGNRSHSYIDSRTGFFGVDL